MTGLDAIRNRIYAQQASSRDLEQLLAIADAAWAIANREQLVQNDIDPASDNYITATEWHNLLAAFAALDKP